MLIDARAGPTGDEVRLAIGMEEDAIGAAAGSEFLDDSAGLGIDDDDAVVKDIGGVDEVSVGRHGDVADEVVVLAVGFGDDSEDARWL